MRSLLSFALVAAAYAHPHQPEGHKARHHALAAQLDDRARGDPYPSGSGYDVPPLDQITALTAPDAPAAPTVPLPEVFDGGATGTLANAPALPTGTIDRTQWPASWAVPDTESPEVKLWMNELADQEIPKLSATIKDPDHPCEVNLQNVPPEERGESGRCWWTCGSCTRDTDITTCSDNMNWGLTFDDGPGPYTPKLLTYLESQSLQATFYLIGQNIVDRPETVKTEYMTGHEISIHTWSHQPLTTLTNEQIVAELGWTRKAIKDVIGVTPRTFRPPYGDIDDRVRAIGAAMGLTPVIWTGVDDDHVFDTGDWNVHGGGISAANAKAQFGKILDIASSLDHGVIVLEHDIYQETIDLAIISTIPDALARGFTLQPVTTCLNRPMSDAYVETSGSSDPLPANGGKSNPSGPSGASGPSGSGSASKTPSQPTSKTSAGSSGSSTPSPSQTAAAVTHHTIGKSVAIVAIAVGGFIWC